MNINNNNDIKKRDDYPCHLSHKTHHPSLITMKSSDPSQMRDMLQNTWPGTPQNCPGCQEKENLRNCHSQDKPKETWMSKCNTVSWMGSWNRKRTLGKI